MHPNDIFHRSSSLDSLAKMCIRDRPGSQCDNQDADYADNGVPQINSIKMTERHHPFTYEVSRYFFSSEVQSEDIGNLCRKMVTAIPLVNPTIMG